MAARNTVKPGQIVPSSGQYREVGPRGGQSGESESTMVRGDRVPPTSAPNRRWEEVDRTKHKS